VDLSDKLPKMPESWNKAINDFSLTVSDVTQSFSSNQQVAKSTFTTTCRACLIQMHHLLCECVNHACTCVCSPLHKPLPAMAHSWLSAEVPSALTCRQPPQGQGAHPSCHWDR
jgi:hypothetical protein